MFGSPSSDKLPQTIDQVADLLISELYTDHVEAMANLSGDEFETLYREVAPYLIDEFRIWTGNDALLTDCFNTADPNETYGPARIILRRVIERLGDTVGVVIIS